MAMLLNVLFTFFSVKKVIGVYSGQLAKTVSFNQIYSRKSGSRGHSCKNT